MESELKRLVDG